MISSGHEFSRHSSMIVKLVGRNAIPVLAMLFLLSLQRTIISVLSFMYITYENGVVEQWKSGLSS